MPFRFIRRDCLSTSASEPGNGAGTGRLLPAVAVAVSVVVILGAFLLAGRSAAVDDGMPATGEGGADPDRHVAASVGDRCLYADEISLVGTGPGPESWVEDELLAQLAVESGLEDPVVSGFIQRRARQVYLRDLMLESALASVEEPTADEVMALMRTDSLLYLVERHYFEILTADSLAAESLRARISAGQSFQVTAENISLGQKAAIGGDMGFMVGGELTGRGFPAVTGRLDGLGGVVGSDLGWHIVLVTETRPLTDPARVVQSLSQVMLEQERLAGVDSLLDAARAVREGEVDESCWR